MPLAGLERSDESLGANHKPVRHRESGAVKPRQARTLAAQSFPPANLVELIGCIQLPSRPLHHARRRRQHVDGPRGGWGLAIKLLREAPHSVVRKIDGAFLFGPHPLARPNSECSLAL